MLSTPAPFPQVGAAAFLRPDGPHDGPEACRILRRHDDDTVLIALTDRRFPREIASGNRTVPLADLFETAEAAVGRAIRSVQSRTGTGRTRRETVAAARDAVPPALPSIAATPNPQRASRRKAR